MSERTFGESERAGRRDADRHDRGVTEVSRITGLARGRARSGAAAAHAAGAADQAAMELAEQLVDCVSSARRDWRVVAELAAALAGLADALSRAGSR
jgi:hypothetical protein